MKVRNPIRPTHVTTRHNQFALMAMMQAITIMVLLYTSLLLYKQSEAHHAEMLAVQAQLIACLNGQAAWIGTDGVEVGCFKAAVNEH